MRKSNCNSLCLCLALFLGTVASTGSAQAQQPAALVIEGGTLIDGNGGAPVPDSVIIIQGNKITNVARKGQGSYPANAQVIKADGKFVLPGLIDAQVSYTWSFGEAMLNHGITSTIDISNGGEVSVAHRDGVFLGKIRGPRTFTGPGRIDGVRVPRWSTGLESKGTPGFVPKSVQEARDHVKYLIASGADYINIQDGSLPMEILEAAFDEAKRAGKAVLMRPYGPVAYPRDAARLGASGLTHSAGVAYSVGKDKPTVGRSDQLELDLYSDMDEAKAKDLIQTLVEHKTALVPNFVMQYPGYPKDWSRFEMEARKLFSDQNLLAYYPPDMRVEVLESFSRGDRGAVRERRMEGWQNALRFHKMLVDAGGRVVVGGNTNATKTPGLNLHHEMAILSEAGFAPMQIIQAATRWPAEMIGKQSLVGTIETGKLADVLIVDEDPLVSVGNLAKINTLIFDGKVVDRTYHSWYTTPFLSVANGGSPPVDGLPWVVAFRTVTFGGPPGQPGAGSPSRPAGGALPNPALARQPAIETINPVMVTEGSPTLTLTLKGFNFVRKSVVYFDGKPVSYRAAGPTELQVSIDADLLRTAGRYEIVVKNPEPLGTDPLWGNGTSNKAHLIVNYKR